MLKTDQPRGPHEREDQEFLLRVSMVCHLYNQVPLSQHRDGLVQGGWTCEQSGWDVDTDVQYATYSKIVKQKVTGNGPDIDELADLSSSVQLLVDHHYSEGKVAYEKRVHLITHPIAVWGITSGRDI